MAKTKPVSSRFNSIFAAVTAFAFLLTTVAAPVAEANFWQDRRDAAQRSREGDGRDAPLYAQLPAAGRGIEGAVPSITSSFSATLVRPIGEPLARVASGVRASDIPSWLRTLPSSAGEIRRIHMAKKPGKAPTVVLIQDVHDIVSAQKNIAQILSHVNTAATGDKVLVGVEGAVGEFDLDPFRAQKTFPGFKVACDVLLQSHLISASEYFAFQSEKRPSLWGVESPADYIENVRAYRESRPILMEVEKQLARAQGTVAERSAKVFSKDLLELDRALSSYAKGTLPFADYIHALASRVPKAERGSEIVKLLDALERESRLDFNRVESERAELIQALSEKMDPPSLQKLLAASLAYRAGQISYSGYYRELKALVQRQGLRWADFPGFNQYVEYVLVSESIDKFALFDQVDELKSTAVGRMVRSDGERFLATLGEDLRLVDRLVRNEFGPAEWTRYQSRRESLARLNERVQQAAGTKSLPVPTPETLARFERFYRASDLRNRSLSENLLAKARESDATVLILIAGGFHTPELEKIFERGGLSVVTVTPQVGAIPTGSNYLDFFIAKHVPLEQMLAGERLYLAPYHGNSQPLPGESFTRGPDAMGALFAAAATTAAGMENPTQAQIESVRQSVLQVSLADRVHASAQEGVVMGTAERGPATTVTLIGSRHPSVLTQFAQKKGLTANIVYDGQGGVLAVVTSQPAGVVDRTVGRSRLVLTRIAVGGARAFRAGSSLIAHSARKWVGRVEGYASQYYRAFGRRFPNLKGPVRFALTHAALMATGALAFFGDPTLLVAAATGGIVSGESEGKGPASKASPVIERGLAYREGRLTTDPVRNPFRPSVKEDVPLIAEMNSSDRRHYMEIGLRALLRGRGVFSVLAAGAASRMNAAEAPAEAKAMLNKMYGGRKSEIHSKAAVPIAEKEGRIYTFLGAFLTNISRVESTLDRVAGKQTPRNRVSILTNNEYSGELSEELDSQNKYGVTAPIETPRQELGDQYIATVEDTKKLESKLGAKYSAALALAQAAEDRVRARDVSAVVLPNERTPLGHGEYFHQMVSSGKLLDYFDSNIEWIYVRNIDNAAATIDEDWLVSLGLFLERGLDFQGEVSPRVSGMKGGALIVNHAGQLVVTEGPSFGATWKAVVKEKQPLSLLAPKPLDDKMTVEERQKAEGEWTDLIERIETAFVQNGEVPITPTRMDYRATGKQDSYDRLSDAIAAARSGELVAFYDAKNGRTQFVRLIVPESTYWFNDAAAFFRPQYLYYIYRQGPDQSLSEFVEEMRQAGPAEREAIAARGRARFPTLVDPKPAISLPAVAVKIETNMWQGTQLAAESGAQLGAAGVYSIQKLLSLSPGQEMDEAQPHLRFLATKQWGEEGKPVIESYWGNKPHIAAIIDRFHREGKDLFPLDLLPSTGRSVDEGSGPGPRGLSGKQKGFLNIGALFGMWVERVKEWVLKLLPSTRAQSLYHRSGGRPQWDELIPPVQSQLRDLQTTSALLSQTIREMDDLGDRRSSEVSRQGFSGTAVQTLLTTAMAQKISPTAEDFSSAVRDSLRGMARTLYGQGAAERFLQAAQTLLNEALTTSKTSFVPIGGIPDKAVEVYLITDQTVPDMLRNVLDETDRIMSRFHEGGQEKSTPVRVIELGPGARKQFSKDLIARLDSLRDAGHPFFVVRELDGGTSDRSLAEALTQSLQDFIDASRKEGFGLKLITDASTAMTLKEQGFDQTIDLLIWIMAGTAVRVTDSIETGVRSIMEALKNA